MSYPVDQNAVQQMQYPPQTQWVDSPSAAPPPQPVEQDMVFQWVDTPSYGRPTAHQQHYLQAPPASPYGFQGMETPHRGLDPGHLAQHHGLDPHFAAQSMDPYGRYGPPAQGGGYQLFDQSGGRRGQGGRQGTQGVGGRGGRQMMDDSKGRNRQPTTGNRQGAAGDSSVGGGCGGGQRRGMDPVSADAQTAAVLESMGTEGLRATLVSILESLYEDRIKPMANYVKGRLKERSTPEPMVKSFVELYAQHPDLFIVQQPAPGSQTDEATIFFQKASEPSWFKGWVDIDAPDDPYQEVTWSELAKFLDGEHTFAGGRYGMARELMQRNLPFLAELSLGEVCHMVQLAIQHRRLIVYHRKMLKPIQTVLCQQLSPANGTGVNAEGEEIKDMDDLCLVLFRMLIHHPQGIRLCRMKQMIKHELCRKLSEMAFQCTKLIELFNQEPLSVTFVLDTENDGKSIYVRLGDPDKFSDHVKRIYKQANSTEAKQALQVGPIG
mmetsp:Transcript_25888/g.86154  ORF Transcript_25888/g.86154 Transcript_25888/m.86154 type:complete len:493 (-) Transcript_25888:133-1611(-)